MLFIITQIYILDSRDLDCHENPADFLAMTGNLCKDSSLRGSEADEAIQKNPHFVILSKTQCSEVSKTRESDYQSLAI